MEEVFWEWTTNSYLTLTTTSFTDWRLGFREYLHGRWSVIRRSAPAMLDCPCSPGAPSGEGKTNINQWIHQRMDNCRASDVLWRKGRQGCIRDAQSTLSRPQGSRITCFEKKMLGWELKDEKMTQEPRGEGSRQKQLHSQRPEGAGTGAGGKARGSRVQGRWGCSRRQRHAKQHLIASWSLCKGH